MSPVTKSPVISRLQRGKKSEVFFAAKTVTSQEMCSARARQGLSEIERYTKDRISRVFFLDYHLILLRLNTDGTDH